MGHFYFGEMGHLSFGTTLEAAIELGDRTQTLCVPGRVPGRRREGLQRKAQAALRLRDVTAMAAIQAGPAERTSSFLNACHQTG